MHPYHAAGQMLKAERERHHLSTRDVERLSRKVAEDKQNREYALSHAWLTEIENGKFIPSIYKLYSLSLIYKCGYDQVLGYFGIHIRDVAKEEHSIILPRTHLLREGLATAPTPIEVPIELRDRVRLEETNLLSRMFEKWGEIPFPLLQRLDLKSAVYGYVGVEDFTLHPLIRPGSFVQIDARQRRVSRGGWKNEFDRPVYFVELREGYTCTWCELTGTQLTLIPSPQSRMQARHIHYPNDAEIVGRVTAVAMSIA